ncbi:MAG: polymorphic toxin type 46 domain-containing protein [Chitinophagaceae bacterium]
MKRKRGNLAASFYAQSGFTAESALSHMEGIDFTKAVQTTTLKKGTIVQQWVGENGVGNYFTPLENGTAKNLGISYEGRTLKQFTLTEDVKV